ncbi:MAG: hypothetical protein K0R67_3336 [Paenibacillus sp.]|jgi:membrane glycosyltransferase|nr:hypothetical protein [Paenibacillus sp.]
MAGFMRAIGLIQIIGSILVGLVIGNMDGWSIAFVCWVSGILGGVVFIAIATMMESIQRIEDNVYQLSRAYFHANPNEQAPPQALGSSRSSLNKMSQYKMGKTEE